MLIIKRHNIRFIRDVNSCIHSIFLTTNSFACLDFTQFPNVYLGYQMTVGTSHKLTVGDWRYILNILSNNMKIPCFFCHCAFMIVVRLGFMLNYGRIAWTLSFNAKKSFKIYCCKLWVFLNQWNKLNIMHFLCQPQLIAVCAYVICTGLSVPKYGLYQNAEILRKVKNR